MVPYFGKKGKGKITGMIVLPAKFNKIRRAAITREVSEITSGLEAMK